LAGFKVPSAGGKGFKATSTGGFGKGLISANATPAADNSPLAAILNFGSAAINTISTPLYAVQGFANEAAKQTQRGANFFDVIGKGAEAGQKNATSWTRGEKTVMGEELLRTLGILKDDTVGDVKIGDITLNLPGLAADILLDPVTYVPFGVFATAAKAPVLAGRAAVKASQLAKTGQLSASVARRAATSPLAKEIVGAAPAGTPIAFKGVKRKLTSAYTPARIEAAQATAKTAAQYQVPLTKLEKTQVKAANIVEKTNPDLLAYKTVQLGGTTLNTVNNQIASAIDAARSAMVATILTDAAKRSLAKTGRREAKLIRQGVASQIPTEAAISTVRQVENAAVKEGESAIQMENGAVETVKPNTVFKDGDTVHVFDGKYVRTWGQADAATNEAAAKAYLESLAKPITKPVVIEGRPLIDSAPINNLLKQITNIKKPSAEIKNINKMLKNLDDIAKNAKGVAIAGDNVAYKVKQILESVDPVKTRFFANLRPEVKNAIVSALKGDRGNLFGLIERAATAGDKQLTSAVNEILNIVVIGTDGRKASIRDIFNSGTPWNKLSSDTRTAIARAVKELVIDNTDTVKVAGARLSELSDLVGPEAAEQIAKTGALDPNAKVFNRGALNKILEGIKAAPKAAEKTYENFDALMAGLRAEDQLGTEVLTKILNAIDPENSLIKQTDKVADADLNEKMANILNQKGMQLVTDARRRLELLDAAKIFKARGLAMHEAISSYLSLRIAGEMPPAGNAVLESRQEAVDRIIRLYDSPDGSLMKRVLTSLGTATDSRMDFLYNEILKAPGASVFVSSFDDAAMRSTTKAFQEGTKAANYLQTNQSFETGLVGSIMGLMRKDAERALTAAEKRLKKVEPKNQVDEFVSRMSLAESAALAILGSRLMTAKYVKTSKFRPEYKHYAYIHLGDFAEVVKRTDREDLVMRSIFPNTGTKTDSFSYVGITDTIRMIMEGREVGIMPDRKILLDRLLSRGVGQETWTKEFADTTKQTAEELVDHLSRKDVIEIFEDIHKTRAVAEVEDNLGEVLTMTQDVINSLLEGYRANRAIGKLTDAARRSTMREAFAKFAFAAGFLEQKTGDQAKSMLEIAATMFIKDGRLAKINGIDEIFDSKVLPEDAGQIDQILGSFDTMYQYKNPYMVPAAGSENIKLPTAAAQAKAAENLTGKESAFDAHMRAWANVKTTEAAKQWATDYKRLSSQLDKAREVAFKNHLPTRHWDNGKWVPTENYNHAKAVQNASKAADRVAIVGDKQVDRLPGMTDSTPIDMGVKLTAAQSKKVVENWNEKAAIRSQELADAASQDAAQHALDVAARIEAEAADPYEAALRMEHERIAFKYSQIEEVVDIPEASVTRYSPTYAGVKYAAQAGVENVSRFKTALGRFNAGTNAEAVSSLRGAESIGFNAKNKISAVTRTLADDMSKLDLTPFVSAGEKFATPAEQMRIMRSRAFSTAFNHALKGDAIPAQYGEGFKKITEKLGRLISATQDQINGLNMPPEVIDRYFSKYGVTGYEGFQAASKYKNPEAFKNFLNDLPFNENPHEIGTDAHTLFAQRKAAFEASDSDAFIMFSNIVFSLIDAKTEQVFVHDFISQFGYKAQGISMKQALDRGYKKVTAIPGSPYDLSVHLAGMEKHGALFDPAMAKEFANLNREWSYMQGKGISPVLRYMMDMTGILKATQTILRPGHVMTNVVGDMTTALIGGARHPRQWTGALRMAKAFMSNRVGAEGFLYSKGNIEQQINSAVTHLARLEKNPKAAMEEATKGGYTVVINGKKQTLPDDFWVSIGEDTGTATDNMVTNDIQGLYESAQARGLESGARGEVAKTQYAKIKDGFDRAIKPAGDVTAYYSNISRFASMLKVVDSKNWSSIEEMKRAITDHVALYHPTITSLAATERRYPRAIFTYYTWLRVAHNALIDMAMNHTAAITLYPKGQTNAAEQAGYDPRSLGDAWGTNKQTTPSYMNYSLYAPMGEEGPRGPVLFKPSILPMDVLDTWNWTYDPYKSFEENNIKNISTTVRKVAGMTNVVAQPIIEAATGTDLLTGTPKQIKDLRGVGDEIISNIGYGTILKGIGAWTPQNKLPENTDNPITDRDRQLYRENWTFGLKRQDLQTISNQRNTQSEQSARLKQFMEWYTKQQKETE
jgi:hypothetical protein